MRPLYKTACESFQSYMAIVSGAAILKNALNKNKTLKKTYTSIVVITVL